VSHAIGLMIDKPAGTCRHCSLVTQWPAVLGFLLIIALSCILRFCNNTQAVISNDEAFSWRIVQYSVGELLERDRDDANPPLYYLTLKIWVKIWGESLTAMRGLSALLGCLTIAALVVFSAELCGGYRWGVGLVAALMACVNPFQVELGRTARSYTLATFLAVLSSWFLWRALWDGRRRWWISYALMATALAYTHYFGLLTIAAQMCFTVGWALLVAPRHGQRRSILLWRIVSAATVIGILYLPWLPNLLRQTRSVWQDFWIPPLSTDILTDLVCYFFTGQRGTGWSFGLVAATTVMLILSGLAIRKDGASIYLLVLMLLPWGIAVGVSCLGCRTVLIDRYLAFAHLFYLIGLGLLLVEVPGRIARFGLMGIILCNFFFETFDKVHPTVDLGCNLERLTLDLARRLGPNEKIIVSDPGLANQVLYYARRSGITACVHPIGEPSKSGGHRVHAASIGDDEWIHPSALRKLSESTVWVVVESNSSFPFPDNWNLHSSRLFADVGLVVWTLNEFKVHRLIFSCVNTRRSVIPAVKEPNNACSSPTMTWCIEMKPSCTAWWKDSTSSAAFATKCGGTTSGRCAPTSS
jgi:mannosyltransferase